MLIVTKPTLVRGQHIGGDICADVTMVGEKASTWLKLFFVFGTVQENDFFSSADSGSARNLIAEEALMKLPFKQPIVDRSDHQMCLSSE